MIRIFQLWLVILGAVTSPAKSGLLAADVNLPTGNALALELRSMAPEENQKLEAILSIREPGTKRRRYLLQIETEIKSDSWTSRYSVFPTNGPFDKPLEVLQIRRGAAVAPEFLHASSDIQSKEKTPLSSLNNPDQRVALRFGTSDFSASDLGLEFLYWTNQQVLKTETRRARDCYVLESANSSSTPSGYSKVISWVDIKTRQILRAEAFDISQKRKKIFKPDEFRYFQGRWHVRQLAIESPDKGSESYLLFSPLTRSDKAVSPR